MTAPAWLDRTELRIGLGCMRLATDPAADQQRSLATIAAALNAGVTVFDTARAYAPSPEDLGAGERLLARALRGGAHRARVVTKGGMTRPGGAWVPDGRAKAILADCEASLEALDGRGIDLYLLHAPDPRTSWRTSVRALARIAEHGLASHVGVCNVNRAQLEAACELAPVSAVQVALSWFDDRARRGGVVEFCAERGIAVIAHSPLGGPRRSSRLAADGPLADVAASRGVTPAEVALAWLLGISPVVVAIPGARRPETIRSAVRAATLTLSAGERERLDGALAVPPAAGDNTYLSRASRSYVIELAARHGLRSKCVWLDTPLDQAQVNLVLRLLELSGSLPNPEQLRVLARREPGVMAPTSQMRALRELEPPSLDEGFDAVEHVEFAREPPAVAGGGRGGVVIAAAALEHAGLLPAIEETAPDAPALIIDWRPGADPDDLRDAAGRLAADSGRSVEAALCPHGAGPPVCWCRPPLPGLPLAFAHAHRFDPAQLTLIGVSAAHQTLARVLGAEFSKLELS
ncbi:MAG: aldo/keto reductase [Solirubrobacteraceae bacterium]